MPVQQLPLDIKLREDATFASYVGRAPQRFSGPGVYVVYGEAGSGKSHLLQAMCHASRAAGETALYVDNPSRHSPELLAGLDSVHTICVDSFDTVLGESAWETVLFHLVNAVRDHGMTLAVAARSAPVSLPIELPDLRSRVLAADAVETDQLDDAQKLRLLQEKSHRQGFELSDEVGRFILTRAERSPRALIDLLAKIEVATLARQRKVTIPLVKSVLAP